MAKNKAWMWAVVFALLFAPQAMAGMLIGATRDAIYDIDPVNGAASNPRATTNALSTMGFVDGVLYGTAGIVLSRVSASTGEVQPMGTIAGLEVFEPIRDLSWDARTNTLFAAAHLGGTTIDRLYTIDLTSLTATLIGEFDAHYTTISFDQAGRLFGIDRVQSTLGMIDPASAATISEMTFSTDIFELGKMTFDDKGDLFAEALHIDGRLMLLEIIPTNASLIPIGTTGLNEGFSSLAYIPEPSSLLLFFLGACVFLARRTG